MIYFILAAIQCYLLGFTIADSKGRDTSFIKKVIVFVIPIFGFLYYLLTRGAYENKEDEFSCPLFKSLGIVAIFVIGLFVVSVIIYLLPVLQLYGVVPR